MASFTFDGKEVEFTDADSFASALHAAGIRTLGRSLKYHRPRGAYCFQGSCAGCLVDVDGEPNVPACMRPAQPATLTSQNRIGSAKYDALGIVDKVYRKGFDPHGAFTRPVILNKAFLKAVRFMSGLGKAPKEPSETKHKRIALRADVLIIGGGREGLQAAQQAEGDVLLVEEYATLGGTARFIPEPDTEELAAALGPNVQVHTNTLAFGHYGNVVGATHNGDLIEITAKEVVIATGRHDAWPLFPGNDKPGVMSLRGAWRLLGEHGVLPGKRIVADGPLPPPFVQALEAAGGSVIATGTIDCAKGSTVERASVNGAWYDCDTIISVASGTPRIELLQQAGCELTFTDVLTAKTDSEGNTTVPGLRAHFGGP